MNPAGSVAGWIVAASGSGTGRCEPGLPPADRCVARHRRPRLALLPLGLLELQGRGQLLLRERHVVVQSRDHDVAKLDGREHVREIRVQEVEHDEDLRTAVAELMLHLALRVQRVVAHDDRAEPYRGIERDHVLRAVRQHEAHSVALADAEARERGRAPLDLGQELRVGHLLAEPRERDGVRMGPRRAFEHAEHRHLGVRLEGVRDAGWVAREPGLVVGHRSIIPERGGRAQPAAHARDRRR